MAKRKAARTSRRAAGQRAASSGRGGAKKKASKKAKKKAAAGRPGARKKAGARKSVASRKGTRRATSRKAAGARTRKAAPTRKRAATKKTSKKTARKQASAKTSRPRRTVTPRSAGGIKPVVALRKSPAVNRPRRTLPDEDDIIQGTPPSSLDLDRSASAARSGRRSLRDRFSEHTETSPALTAGDVDADWESAYSVGDEAPGGDNPTPDQDIVDEIGRAVGLEYQDNEELKGADKLEKRDRNRWELDPASSEDWEDR